MHKSLVTWRGNWGMLRKVGLTLLACVVTAGLPAQSRAQTPSVTLTPSVASPQKLGTPVTWTAALHNAPSGHTYGYQFTVTFDSAAQIVQDFSPTATFLWVPHTVEGAYQVSVIVRDTTMSPYAKLAPVSVSFTLESLLSGGATQAVNPTAHSLVALFSGPPCTAGHQLLVRFHPADSAAAMTTSLLPCSTLSANFLVAGMYPSTQYMMHWEEYDGTSLVSTGADLAFTTGAIPSNVNIPKFQVNVPPTAHDAAYPVILWQVVGQDPIATDLDGNVIWYSPGPYVVRMESGGNFSSYGINSPTGGGFNGNGTFAEYDLAGNQLLQTNIEILNEQLTAKGYPVMESFNGHEARHLPNGDMLLLGSRDMASTSAQGGTPTNPVDIIGDMVLVLDHNLQLLWAWDSFAHEDINRLATLSDTCTQGGAGCPVFNKNFEVANDWLHTNSAQGTADGNIILSQRSQDWVIKINYANGAGDGGVLWRMGAGQDFTIINPLTTQTCGDPNVFPWFTHQHDGAFEFEESAGGAGGTIMTVFDDGNTRSKECAGTQNSRGMILFRDDTSRQVYMETVANLGAYSSALGSGQLLAPGDGNIYASYSNGDLAGPAAQATEVNLSGQIVYQLQMSSLSYRTYRMPNLYTPTIPFTASGVYVSTATPLKFGSIPSGTTEVLPLTITNFGLPGTVTVGTSINGTSYKVLTTAQNTCQAGIMAAQSCILPVEFDPTSVGTYDNVLTIEASGGSSRPTIPLEGVAITGPPVAQVSTIYLPFGTVSFGSTKTLPVTVTNTGGGTLTVATALSGSNNYAIAGSNCGAGVASGSSCTLQVQFSPTSITTHYGLLTVQTNGGNPTVGLKGSVSGLSVFGGANYAGLQFGAVAIGSTKVLTLTVTNVGLPGTVTVGTAIAVRSTTTPTITYKVLTTSQNTCLTGIAAGKSCTLPIEFAPTSSGSHNDLLTLTPSAGSGPTAVWLNGTTP